MPDKPFILMCRCMANFRAGELRPAGSVTRACQICAEPVSLTVRGQEQERSGGAMILCNPCALVMVAKLKEGGSEFVVRQNPAAVESLAAREGARKMYELFEKFLKSH